MSLTERILDPIPDGNMQHQLLALIVWGHGKVPDGLTWLVGPDNALQLGLHSYPDGKELQPHVHLPSERTHQFAQEFLHVLKGCVQVDFYDDRRRPVCSRVLTAGDSLLLVAGGHGFRFLQPTEMIEVKSGPYVGAERDKSKFERPS